MALDINGYNDTFRAFADFAKIMTTGQGDENSIARLDTGVNIAEGSLAGRTITASTTDSVRGIFKWFRSSDDKAANNEVRKLFKDAIIDMFGGESKIPGIAGTDPEKIVLATKNRRIRRGATSPITSDLCD